MTPKLILGNLNYSSWSVRALLTARHAGYACDEEVMPLGEPGTREHVIAASGQHRVPVLVTDAVIIHDSLAIIEWIAEQSPAGAVWPEDAHARAFARSLCAEMHGDFVEIRTHLGMNIRARNLSWPDRAPLQAEIARMIEMWTAARTHYGAAGPYLFGAWSAADAVFGPVATRFRSYGVPLSGVAADYAEAVLAHPLMIALAAEAAAEPWTIDTTKFVPAKAD